MQINDSRHVTTDDYSIEKIEIGYNYLGHVKCTVPFLRISLKPDFYFRDRFAGGGSSYEKKKHGARSLTINFDEFQQMAAVVSNEIQLCYDVLAENNLTSKLEEARKAQKIASQASTAA